MYAPNFTVFISLLAVLFCYFSRNARAQATDPMEVSALKTIRNSLNDPNGNLNSWNSGDPCASNWYGIFCYPTATDGYLHVQKLQLLKLNLSGSLAPELGLLSQLQILDFMWNNINGTIPKEIFNITPLKLLLLSGNELSGTLPDEIGLVNLNRLQIDQNYISGLIPISFANLSSVKHLHMNNNSLSGQIPSELSRLPHLLHLLVDNNNLSGFLPSEFSMLPNLKILQLDNNNFNGSTIPASYGNMRALRKLSLRNCSLQGFIPDLSGVPELSYLDLSLNKLTGSIPSRRLSENVTTIKLAYNQLQGSIPSNLFVPLPPLLQLLSLRNNRLNGSVPSLIWPNKTSIGNRSIIFDFQNNLLTGITKSLDSLTNFTILLYGNSICVNPAQANLVNCQPQTINPTSGSTTRHTIACPSCPTDSDYEYNPLSPIPCSCAIPLGVGFRLKSPGISDFHPYIEDFRVNLSSLLDLHPYQLYFNFYTWDVGPRLNMYLKLYPDKTSLFNSSEAVRIIRMLTGWEITLSDVFGPYEILNLTLGFYAFVPMVVKSSLSKGALVGIVLGSIAAGAIISSTIVIFIMQKRSNHMVDSRRRASSRTTIKLYDVKSFLLDEMKCATDNFSNSSLVGHGGYGMVYRGILADGTVVAIKRAKEASLQGSNEFATEIELLSRLHHRNLVSLVGYCDEEDEQMLIYEFMPNGNLRDHLSRESKDPLSFMLRLRIALETARGILYLHAEADPPIFHRDIKASNILLDSNYTAKVADFGISRLAPLPNVEGVFPDHVSTVVKGTPGYLDPEYFLTHKLTDKSDVYSLGVVFLELLTGMQPISFGKNLVREASTAYLAGRTFEIIDGRMGSYPSDCIEKFVSLAYRCCQHEPDARPSMSETVRELENIWRMTPEADTLHSDPPNRDPEYASAPLFSSSSSTLEYPYMSHDVSGSNLHSSSIPNIKPR